MLLQPLCIISYPLPLVNSNLSYSPQTLNSGQNRRFCEPCDLEILQITLKNNRASLLCYFKLCVSFRTNWCIQIGDTVDSRYLAPVGSQNSRARVKWVSRYLALSREGHDSRIQDHRPALPGVYNSQTVCWAIIEVLTFPGSLHTSTSHQRQITTSNIRF